MPQLLQHIDQIAREKKRDVIYIEFHNFAGNYHLDYRKNPSREIIADWLATNNIPHWECGGPEVGFWSTRYRGEIYIDVPYDKCDPLYLKIESFLENPDGTMRFEGAWFRGLTLASCMLNAHLDEPDAED